MTYGGADALRLLAATLGYLPVLVLPGIGIAFALDLVGIRRLAPGRQVLRGTLVGLGLLPLADSLLIRGVGPGPAAVAHLALLGFGLAWLIGPARGLRIRAAAMLAGIAWCLLVVLAWTDVDAAGGLHQPLLVLDGVKHLATTEAIATSGAPPIDPFFARDGRAGYYYFFYALPALVLRLSGGLLDARAAFCGLVVWTGIGLAGLVDLLLERSRLVPEAGRPRAWAWACLLLPAGGLDLLPVVRNGLVSGTWLPIPEGWTEMVVWWVPSCLWVPHHICGLLAAWLGLQSLADWIEGTPPRGGAPVAILVAGAAFASCAGLSIWVALGAVASAAAWLTWLAVARRWRAAAALIAAGAVSVVLAAPYLVDILANRTDQQAGIAVSIRRFGPVELLGLAPTWTGLANLLLLPVNYYAVFGVFASGALLCWIRFRPAPPLGETDRLLVLTCGAGLVLGSFLASTLINNDLGWRVVLFAQLSAFVWTAAALSRLGRGAAIPARLPRLVVLLLLVGYGTTAYGLVMLRTFRASGFGEMAAFNARPDVDLALRAAYRWASVNLPAEAVLQHNPEPSRVFDFGLYGRHRVGVADPQAMLFGASRDAVEKRLDDLLPIFVRLPAGPEVRDRARAAGLDALVVSAQDPVWQDRSSWVWSAKAVYVDPLVRIVLVADL